MTRYTHDGGGKPLPAWILNGGVAYVPMESKLPSAILKAGGALIPETYENEQREILEQGNKDGGLLALDRL